MSHHAPYESLRHLPADLVLGLVDMHRVVFGLLWDELRRWRLVRLPAQSFDPRK